MPLELLGSGIKLAIFLWWWRLAAGVVPSGKRWLQLGQLVALGLASAVPAFNAATLDRTIYVWVAQRAMPVILLGLAVLYGMAAVRRRAAA